MAQENFQKIREKFTSLLVDVRVALQNISVDVENVHHYLVALFERDDCIPNTSKLIDIFKAVSVAKLWRFDNCRPLENLASKFLPVDDSRLKLITEYKTQLSHFRSTTRIIDYISLQPQILDSGYDSKGDSESDDHLHKLKLKLKPKRKISELTLAYVDTIWRSVIEEFDIAESTVVLKRIATGCLEIEWLVLPSVANKILSSSASAEVKKFFTHQRCILVTVDGRIVYRDKQMVCNFSITVIYTCNNPFINVIILYLYVLILTNVGRKAVV